MIDIHVHFLPGIDDGPVSLEEALAMGKLAVTDGIQAAVVTPHHLNGVYTNEAGRIREEVEAFQEALADEGIPLAIYPGSEVHLVPELPEALAAGTAMTIADRGQAVLVEPPVHSLPLGTEAILDACLAQGITPIVAHAERNRVLRHQLDILERWVARGCRVQVTAQSCTGRFGSLIQQATRRMVEKGLVHIVASDGHRPRGRMPQMSAGREAVAGWVGAQVAELVTVTYPQALLKGQPLDMALLDSALDEALVSRRKSWRWWQRL